MRLLVTGGAGFIGHNFCLYWLEKYPKDSIVNLDNLTYAGLPSNVNEAKAAFGSRYIFVTGDICNFELVNRTVRSYRPDLIVHFAAETHVDRSISGPLAFTLTNVVGTHYLLEAARQNNIRFHHVSTDEVYGFLPLGIGKFTENTPYNPTSPYAASKAAADHLVRAYFKTFGLPITISNCSNNYGPYQFPEKLIPLAITNLLQDRKVPVYGDGLYVRDWLYVLDHCRAIDLIIQSGRIGETYLIGGQTQDLPNIQIIKQILRIMGKSEDEIEWVKDRPAHDRRYAVDWSKIHRQLGWSPHFDFEDWLRMTINWYSEHEEWWKALKGQSLDQRDWHKT